MISVAPPALHQALQLLRTPTGLRPAARERLPEGMLLLIRIVAGDETALTEARQRSEEPNETVREAAAFYIQQVMFASGSDSYRLLGVDADAADERIKEHYRWLVRWLHPDRNADEWEVVYADRVNRAWQDLRTPERRQRFDESRSTASAGATAGQASVRTSGESTAAPLRQSPAAVAAYDDSAGGYNALRWLPKLIFGGLGVCAVLALGLLWLLRAPPLESAPPGVAKSEAVAPRDEPAKTPESQAADASLATEATLPAEEVPVESEAVAAVTPAFVPNESTPAPSLAPEPNETVAPTLVAAAPVASVARAASKPEKVAPLPPSRRQPAPAVVAPRDARRSGAAAPAAIAVATTAPPAQTPVAQAAARNEVADGASGLPAIDDRVANRLVGQLSQAYGDGDLQRMRSLVTSNAVGGSGDLLDEYDRLFASSEQRSLSISNVSWLQDGDSATIIATYVATVQARAGKRARRSGGDMRLDLRVEGGQWRIYRLSHDGGRG